MGFKDNVLFYLNEAKKDKDYEEKRKVCAGDEADGSSVKTEKKHKAYTGSEACMASKKTENGCTGSEASGDTEEADKITDKEAKKVTYGAVAKRNRMFHDNQDYLDRYVDALAKKNKKPLAATSTEVKTVDNEIAKYKEKYGDTHKFTMNQEWNREKNPHKRTYDKTPVLTTKDVIDNYEEPKPTKGKKMVPNSKKVEEITKEAAKYASKKTEKCPECGKAKCECSCDSEASTVAAYDQRKFKVQKETNELKKDSKMKGYEVGKMAGVGNGRKPSMEKYSDFGMSRAEKDPNTNEIAKDKKMKGYSLKEEMSSYAKNICMIEEDAVLTEKAVLITESIKNKSASKKLLKVAKKMEVAATKIDDRELHDAMMKNAKMFRQAYIEISAAEDAYRSGDVTAKEKYKKLTKKYAVQFKTVNKGKITKLVAGGFGVAAVIILVAGAILIGIQGIFEPGEQLEGIAKLTVNSPLDGIKQFFGFGKKIVTNDITAVKDYFGAKDFASAKEALAGAAAADKDMADTLQNTANAKSSWKEATAGKGEVKNSIKDFISKMGKKGSSDEGDSSFTI